MKTRVVEQNVCPVELERSSDRNAHDSLTGGENSSEVVTFLNCGSFRNEKSRSGGVLSKSAEWLVKFWLCKSS